jgi:hypothetical protein
MSPLRISRRIAAKNDPLLAAAMPVIFALEAELAAKLATISKLERLLVKKKRLGVRLQEEKKRLLGISAEQPVAHDLD